MARDDLHFRLRIPEDLKLKVEEAAKENHRSMTAEIIARLESSFAAGTDDNIHFRQAMLELMAMLLSHDIIDKDKLLKTYGPKTNDDLERSLNFWFETEQMLSDTNKPSSGDDDN